MADEVGDVDVAHRVQDVADRRSITGQEPCVGVASGDRVRLRVRPAESGAAGHQGAPRRCRWARPGPPPQAGRWSDDELTVVQVRQQRPRQLVQGGAGTDDDETVRHVERIEQQRSGLCRRREHEGRVARSSRGLTH